MKKSLYSERNNDSNQKSNQIAKLSGLGIELLVINLIFIWGGYQLDKSFEMKFPIFIILGLIFAVIATVYRLFKLIN